MASSKHITNIPKSAILSAVLIMKMFFLFKFRILASQGCFKPQCLSVFLLGLHLFFLSFLNITIILDFFLHSILFYKIVFFFFKKNHLCSKVEQLYLLPTSPNLCISDSPVLLLEYQLYSDATHCITGLPKAPWTQGTTKLPLSPCL